MGSFKQLSQSVMENILLHEQILQELALGNTCVDSDGLSLQFAFFVFFFQNAKKTGGFLMIK